MPILGVIASSRALTITGAMEPIAVATVPSGGLASVTFGSIPQTYTHLQVRCIIRGTATLSRESVKLQFNSDTGANYNRHLLFGDGSAAFGYGQANDNYVLLTDFAGASASANIYGAAVVDILDYANTNKFKTARGIGGVDCNAAVTVYNGLFSAVWRNTNAITTMTFSPYESNSIFAQYSSFALYGIKGA